MGLLRRRGWTPLRFWSFLLDPGGLLPTPSFPLRDLHCELALPITMSSYLVRPVSMYYDILYFIILSGGVEDGSGDGRWYGNVINTILSFNKREESWQPAGQMEKERSGHAVAAIDDVSQLCP